jgi:putative ABC transport system permease protein
VIPLSYNVRSILRRRFSALATAAGLGLVVFVFAAVLMLASGVEETLRSTGSPQNAIILRKGSSSELTSGMPRDAAKVFAADPTVAIDGGKAMASPELFVIFQLARVDGNGTANVAFRGFTHDGYELVRKETVHVVDGRLPQAGTSEVMIGRSMKGRYVGAQVGQSIHIARRDWQVVGLFEANGSGFESEIWADADQIADAMHRTGYSSMTVRLKYYEEASGQLAAFIRALGTVIAVFFALGATLGAMITMYAQVASRVREIGTLRALGFRRRSVLGSFLVESIILSLLGALAGCCFAALLSTLSFTTTNFSSFTEVKFRFHFAPAVAVKASFFALMMGLFGGLLPALRAARLPIAEATKG